MKAALSLRARVLIGALLWTAGLFMLSGAALTQAMRVHPRAPADVHALFEGTLPVVVALVCLAAGFQQVRSGLSGIKAIRGRLAQLHAGRERRLAGAYPSEVQPLVEDLNVLLDERDRTIERALAKTADLAHGLKTPLAVLEHDAERAATAGQPDLSASIRQQVDRMRRQVDYHLAHARAASGPRPGSRSDVRASVDGLVRALTRLHADRRLSFEVRIAEACAVRAEAPDLDEMLGNLLDNACRFAQSRIVTEARTIDGQVRITVDDDGPGLTPDMWTMVLQRGIRADESGPGSGLGLAIVRDLAELHGGSIELSRSRYGGLRAELRMPASGATSP